MHFLTVQDLMSSPVITIPPHTRLPMIKQLMRLKRIHRLPVVDRGKLLGIVTLGDVRNAYPSDAPSLVHKH
ncbi:MAG TPA: CBS domain-containing protein, partial [Herpetosiphonaceae bacterium]|nr:CBS domain-containing protein [Herpetosiphonaceae bacterium]